MNQSCELNVTNLIDCPLHLCAVRYECQSPTFGKHVKRQTLCRKLTDRLHNTDTGCQIWTGTHDSHGYGVIETSIPSVKRKRMWTHRLAYMICHGVIPDNLCVLHRCDNPLCCNPDHLFLGTRKDNIHDALSKNRALKGEKNGQSKLTTTQVIEIRQLYDKDRCSANIVKIALQYNVRPATVYDVVANRTWRHV